jgi:hypothetical protein
VQRKNQAKMKKKLFILIYFFTVTFAHAQAQFQMRYGSSYHDHASKVIQTQDGNYVVVGSTDGFGSNGNAMIMKANAAGTLLWVKDYSGINPDEINDIIELSDKSLVMCGTTGSYGAGEDDFFVMKTDSVGTLMWASAHGTFLWETFLRITEDGTGGYYAAGYASDSVNNGVFGNIVMRLDVNGNILWTKWVDGWCSGAMDITPLASGGVIIGSVVDPCTNFSLYKFDALGNLIWSKNYLPTPTFSGLYGLSILENSSGEIIVNCALNNQNTVAQSTDDFIIKLNANGNLISDNAYGGTYTDVNSTIINTSDGGLMLCGYTNSVGNGSDDAFLIKLNSNGSVHWAKAYGTPWQEHPTNPIQTTDGGYVFTGETYSVGNNYDSAKVYLVKTDSLGNTSCHGIIWNPTETNQTISIGSATPPINRTYQKTNISWALNNRYFYAKDICAPTSVFSLTETKSWNIYPNPFSAQATLQTDKFLNDATLTLYNSAGEQVEQINNISGNTVNLTRDNLSSGLYFFRLTQDNKIITAGKLVIEDN